MRMFKPQSLARSLLLLPVLVLAMSPAMAQSLPSAGGQLRQIPPVTNTRDSDTPTAIQAPAATDSNAATGPVSTLQFKVDRIQLTGVSKFAEAELLQVAGFEPARVLNLTDLKAMSERITLHYRQNGYLVARAYVPAQEIRDAVATLSVLEGQYGQVQLNNKSALDKQVPQDVLRDLQQGDVITLAPLEERLLLLSDLPGVQVRSTLVPGASLGLSDLVVDITPDARISGSLDADNAGSPYTGEERIGLTLNLNNPRGRGDLASLRVLTSGAGLRYGRVAYQVPLGRARVGVSYSDLAYALGRDFAVLGAHGHARVAALFGSYTRQRTRQSNQHVGVSLESKRFHDQIDAEPSVTDKRAQVAVVTAYGDQRDAWGGGGFNSYSLAWTAGSIDILTPIARQRDAETAHSHGPFSKLAFALSRVQRANDSLSLYGSLSGQIASKNLDVSEKMALGGMYGVRAYPEGEAYADEGALLSLEARQQLRIPGHATGQWQVAAFMDAGIVKLHHQPWLSTKQRRLSGAGVGVYWTKPGDFSVKAFYARKLGSEKALSAPDRSARAWVQAVSYF
jgi:hemolysin activation/secretion protein